jgi:hypothetical protein
LFDFQRFCSVLTCPKSVLVSSDSMCGDLSRGRVNTHETWESSTSSYVHAYYSVPSIDMIGLYKSCSQRTLLTSRLYPHAGSGCRPWSPRHLKVTPVCYPHSNVTPGVYIPILRHIKAVAHAPPAIRHLYTCTCHALIAHPFNAICNSSSR